MRTIRRTILAVAIATFVLTVLAAEAPLAPDLILLNGHVVTVDRQFSMAQAIAISAGRVTAIGATVPIRRLADAHTNVIDLRGKTVVPGLSDDHLHDAGGGPGVDLASARSLEDVLTRVADRVRQSRPGALIVSNSDWHEAQLHDQRLPLRADLDRVAPSNPVVLVRGGHEYILNSAALMRWNISKATVEPAGGRITRDANGELNGELVDRARALVQLPPPPPLTMESLAVQHRTLNAAGLTSIRYPGASVDQYRLLQQMKARGQLTIRVNQLMRIYDYDDPAKMRALVAEWGVSPDEGDQWLRIGGMKTAVDGGFEGGWMRTPYAEPYGEGGRFRGLNTVPAEKYTPIIRELNRMGWRVATHAVGDAAIDEVLEAYEAADLDQPISGKRWTIEHGFIPQADQFPRMKKLGLVVSAQDHLYLAGPSLVKYWGLARAAWTTPVRRYLDEGFVVAGGTDAGVVPFNPLWVFYHFVTRAAISGVVLGADQAISRQEALKLLTINNAYLTFEEQDKGSIEPGKLADLVVLPKDILTCPAKEIETMRVDMTIVGGRIVFRRDGV